jgi:hypothetical protein
VSRYCFAAASSPKVMPILRQMTTCAYFRRIASSRPDRLWCSPGDLQRPLIGRDRNTIPTMASNGDGAVRRDQTSDLQLLVDSAPSLIDTGRPDGYLDFFNQTWLTFLGRSRAEESCFADGAVVVPPRDGSLSPIDTRHRVSRASASEDTPASEYHRIYIVVWVRW